MIQFPLRYGNNTALCSVMLSTIPWRTWFAFLLSVCKHDENHRICSCTYCWRHVLPIHVWIWVWVVMAEWMSVFEVVCSPRSCWPSPQSNSNFTLTFDSYLLIRCLETNASSARKAVNLLLCHNFMWPGKDNYISVVIFTWINNKVLWLWELKW